MPTIDGMESLSLGGVDGSQPRNDARVEQGVRRPAEHVRARHTAMSALLSLKQLRIATKTTAVNDLSTTDAFHYMPNYRQRPNSITLSC